MGSSLLLLAAALDSNNPNGIFAGLYHAPVHTCSHFFSFCLLKCTRTLFLCVNFYVSDLYTSISIYYLYVIHLNILTLTCYLRILRCQSCSRLFNACRHGPASDRVWPGHHYDLSQGCSPPLPPPFLVCVVCLVCVCSVCAHTLCACVVCVCTDTYVCTHP
jgi:hypothetical protein